MNRQADGFDTVAALRSTNKELWPKGSGPILGGA